jgi:hypothetical protein
MRFVLVLFIRWVDPKRESSCLQHQHPTHKISLKKTTMTPSETALQLSGILMLIIQLEPDGMMRHPNPTQTESE